jgi:predicted nucleic acid-binding protein
LSTIAVDTSVIIAGLLAWHESHEAALSAMVTSRAAPGARLIVPAPALVEAYAVMTRLPAPHRLAPANAIDILAGSFEQTAEVVSLGEAETWRFLHEVARQGLAGGRTYDALILRCAQKAGATRLLTLDRRDFERLDLAGIELIVPGM